MVTQIHSRTQPNVLGEPFRISGETRWAESGRVVLRKGQPVPFPPAREPGGRLGSLGVG